MAYEAIISECLSSMCEVLALSFQELMIIGIVVHIDNIQTVSKGLDAPVHPQFQSELKAIMGHVRMLLKFKILMATYITTETYQYFRHNHGG